MMNPSFSLTLNLTIPNDDALLFTLMCLREKLSRHVGSKRSPLAPDCSLRVHGNMSKFLKFVSCKISKCHLSCRLRF